MPGRSPRAPGGLCAGSCQLRSRNGPARTWWGDRDQTQLPSTQEAIWAGPKGDGAGGGGMRNTLSGGVLHPQHPGVSRSIPPPRCATKKGGTGPSEGVGPWDWGQGKPRCLCGGVGVLGGGGGRIWGGRSPATGSRRRRLGRRAGCAGPAVAAALGVSTLTAQCLHLSIFPSPGPLLPGVISCPLRSPPTAPACPSPAASSRPPRGLSMLPENKSHAIFNRGENAKVSSSLGCCGAECGRAPPER